MGSGGGEVVYPLRLLHRLLGRRRGRGVRIEPQGADSAV